MIKMFARIGFGRKDGHEVEQESRRNLEEG